MGLLTLLELLYTADQNVEWVEYPLGYWCCLSTCIAKANLFLNCIFQAEECAPLCSGGFTSSAAKAGLGPTKVNVCIRSVLFDMGLILCLTGGSWRRMPSLGMTQRGTRLSMEKCFLGSTRMVVLRIWRETVQTVTMGNLSTMKYRSLMSHPTCLRLLWTVATHPKTTTMRVLSERG